MRLFSRILSNKTRNIHTSLSALKNKNPTSSESPLKQLLADAASFEDANTDDTSSIRSQNNQKWSTMPYPSGTRIRHQGEYFSAKKDPRDASIILFPGQGSQYVGMAKSLLKFPMARDLFELANHILGYDLLKICNEGPKERLDATEYCQPAIVVTSLAAIERLKEERPMSIEHCVSTAGFSVGEMTALIFSGALEFERGLRLVKKRAGAMQAASDAYKGGMLSVFYGPDSRLGLAIKEAKEYAISKGDAVAECQIANYLYPHNKVVAGSENALEFLIQHAKDYNLRRVTRLPVSGAFHSKLMEPAVEPFRQALKKSKVLTPAIRVYSNVDACQYANPEQIIRLLPKQIVKPVKWEQIMHKIYERSDGEHFPRSFECGPGTTLRSILKQVNAKAWNNSFKVEL